MENQKVLHIPEGTECVCNWCDVPSALNGYSTSKALSEKQVLLIEEIYIPKTVCKIEIGAFTQCHNLKEIFVDATNPYFTAMDGVLYNKQMTKLICCPSAYEATEFTIPKTVTRIAAWAFFDCRIRQINPLDCVKHIGHCAFEYSRLETICLPGSLQSIEYATFRHCVNLKSVSIPQGIKAIKPLAFYECTHLAELHLPASLETIGMDAFTNMFDLTKVTIAEDNQHFSIKDGILYSKDCTELLFAFPYADNELIIVPNSVKTIPGGSFYNIPGLEHIYIPKQVETIDELAFNYPADFTIHCEENSYAHTFAKEYDISHSFERPKQREHKPENTTIDGKFQLEGDALVRYSGNESVVTVPDCVHKICSYVFRNKNIKKSLSLIQ